MNELEQIRAELEVIKTRNAKVEADKAWETSLFRKLLILVLTYLIASLAMWAIGVPNFYINALIPTLGFFLSTLSLSFIKGWWIKRFF
jgi:preprotein translocase subunit SecF